MDLSIVDVVCRQTSFEEEDRSRSSSGRKRKKNWRSIRRVVLATVAWGWRGGRRRGGATAHLKRKNIWRQAMSSFNCWSPFVPDRFEHSSLSPSLTLFAVVEDWSPDQIKVEFIILFWNKTGFDLVSWAQTCSVLKNNNNNKIDPILADIKPFIL